MNEELKLLKTQNILLKGLLLTTIEMLPKHSRGCYGLQVHPTNKESCCDCKMQEIKDKVLGLLK